MTIAEINDHFRTDVLTRLRSIVPGRATMTRGVAALPADVLAQVLDLVRTFNVFTFDNDPHREHDMGRIETAGVSVFWKIDYYADSQMEYGSDDAADLTRSYRLLTIMLTEEY